MIGILLDPRTQLKIMELIVCPKEINLIELASFDGLRKEERIKKQQVHQVDHLQRQQRTLSVRKPKQTRCLQ